MGANVSSVHRMYSDRNFYNSKFVDKKLLQPSYIRRMLSVCKYVKPNVSFVDVLRREQSLPNEGKLQNLVRKSCEVKNAKGKNKVHSGNVFVNTLVHKHAKAVKQDQSGEGRYNKVVQGVQSAGKQNIPVSRNMNSQFIHVNRFQPLVSHVESGIDNKCQAVVESNIVKENKHAGTVVSVYLKDGKGNKGKKVSNAHNVTMVAEEELGSTKYSSGTDFGSAKCSKTNETDIPASNTHIPAIDPEIQHLGSANLAFNRFNDSKGEGHAETVSFHNSSVLHNSQKGVTDSRSNGEELCDTYALEIHVSSKRERSSVA